MYEIIKDAATKVLNDIIKKILSVDKKTIKTIRRALGLKGYQKPLPYKLSSKMLKRKLKQRGK